MGHTRVRDYFFAPTGIKVQVLLRGRIHAFGSIFMDNFLKRNGGIIAGGIYGLTLRLILNIEDFEMFSLFSIAFLWIAPVVIGLIPLFFATNEQVDNWGFRVSKPVWTVVVFFFLCFITRIEDLICLWVLLLPYALGALVSGMILGKIIKRIRIRKGTFYSIMVLPLIVCPIEQQFDKPVDEYSVATTVVIQATPQDIWKNIVRVREIGEDEYLKGFFNYAGLPRPRYAELNGDSLGATRIGHFEGGLKFVETVNDWQLNKRIGFDIVVVASSVRQTVFDQHVLMGNHFRFLNAAYTLNAIDSQTTELILKSTYQLNTNINGYASFCGNQLLTDFQERLLKVIKKRCEVNE